MLSVVLMVFLMLVNTLFLKNNTLEAIRNGETPDVDGYKGHLRECYVVAAPDADKAKIENEIKTMENYFVGYETVVNFISQEELDRDHKGIPHGGFVLRSGESTDGTRHVIEYSLKLDSNPEFTGSALVAYARGIYRLAKHGGTGCYTVFDIPPAWISTQSAEELTSTFSIRNITKNPHLSVGFCLLLWYTT